MTSHSTTMMPASWAELQKLVQGKLILLDSQASWDSFKLFNSASRPLGSFSAQDASSSPSSSAPGISGAVTSSASNLSSTSSSSTTTTSKSPSSSASPAQPNGSSSSTSSSSSSTTTLSPPTSASINSKPPPSSPAVFYPKSSKDVLIAMNFAYRHGLEISVKSGGHNPSNWSTSGQLILDLKGLKSVVVRPRSSLIQKEKENDGDGAVVVEESSAGGDYRINPPVDPNQGAGAEADSPDLREPTVHERDVKDLSISGVVSLANGNGNAERGSGNHGENKSNGSTSNNNNNSNSSNKRKQSSPSPSPEISRPSAASGEISASRVELVHSGEEAMESAESMYRESNSSTPQPQQSQLQQSQRLSTSLNNSQIGSETTMALSSSSSSNNNSNTKSAGKRRMLDGHRRHDAGTPHYIQANAYPPFHLINANEEQRKAFHDARTQSTSTSSSSSSSFSNSNDTNNGQKNSNERRSGSNGASGSGSGSGSSGDDEARTPPVLPFIHDPIRKSTVFPANAPPGTISFSTSTSSTSSSSGQSGNNASRTAGSFAASSTNAAAQLSNPWPVAPESYAEANGSFGAASPSEYTLVTFGSGTTAHHLDSVTATSKYTNAAGNNKDGDDHSDDDNDESMQVDVANDHASNSAGIECFVPWACYPVGSAIFLTGGYGFVSRLYGLSMDLMTELELVLPPGAPDPRSSGAASGDDLSVAAAGKHTEEGRIVHLKVDYASDPTLSNEEKREQEELWWACRGAGTGFGIVTKITAKAFRIGQVLAGNVIFPFNSVTTPSLLKHWRDCLKIAPRELYTNITLSAGPSERGHVVVLQFSWCGKTVGEGESILQTILSWDGERCLLKDVEVRPYKHQQENVSQILSSKDDTRWLVRSTLLKSLSDASIHKTVDLFRASPPGCSWLFETAGAAIAEPKYPSCFPMEHRKAPFQVAALHQWIDPIDDLRQKQLAESWIYECLKDEACGPFPCFLSSGEGKERITSVYGKENWARLLKLKAKYDPYHVMKHNHMEDAL